MSWPQTRRKQPRLVIGWWYSLDQFELGAKYTKNRLTFCLWQLMCIGRRQWHLWHNIRIKMYFTMTLVGEYRTHADLVFLRQNKPDVLIWYSGTLTFCGLGERSGRLWVSVTSQFPEDNRTFGMLQSWSIPGVAIKSPQPTKAKTTPTPTPRKNINVNSLYRKFLDYYGDDAARTRLPPMWVKWDESRSDAVSHFSILCCFVISFRKQKQNAINSQDQYIYRIEYWSN